MLANRDGVANRQRRRTFLRLALGGVSAGLAGCTIPGLRNAEQDQYPFTPHPFTEVEGQLSPTAVLGGADYPSSFGSAVAMTDDTVFVGAPRADTSGKTDAGAVYVSHRLDGEWRPPEPLPAATEQHEEFGSQIVASGDTALVKRYSQTNPINEFKRGIDRVWTRAEWKIDTVEALATSEIALTGDTAILGGTEKVHMVEQAGGQWEVQQTIEITAGKRLIASAAADGATAVLGFRPKGGLTNIGRAYFFDRVNGSWEQTAMFEGGYRFGSSVAVSGDTAAVLDSSNNTVNVFRQTDGQWERHEKFTWTHGELPLSGPSVVELDGQTILVGSRGREAPGEFHLLRLDDGATSRRGTTQSSPDGGERFGEAVALADGTAVVADPGKRTVYLYEV